MEQQNVEHNQEVLVCNMVLNRYNNYYYVGFNPY
jgi:hypothetical protein